MGDAGCTPAGARQLHSKHRRLDGASSYSSAGASVRSSPDGLMGNDYPRACREMSGSQTLNEASVPERAPKTWTQYIPYRPPDATPTPISL